MSDRAPLKKILHEPAAKRYALYLDGVVAAVADYAVSGNSISFHHTFTNPSFRGQGLAGEVVTYAMDDVEKTTTRTVVPMCSYVSDWFAGHPERSGLLLR